MKILILGTSNSIIKQGWTSGFRSALEGVAEIESRSVGASSGLQFAAACCEDLRGYDFVIFDSIVNDENIFAQDGQWGHYSRMIEMVLGNLAAQTNLIVLGFCNRKYLDERSRHWTFQKDLARRLGAPFFSVVDFAAAATEGEPYVDPRHVKHWHAAKFGTWLASYVQFAGRAPQVETPVASPFRLERLVGRAGTVEAFSNSIMTQEFAVMGAGDRVVLERPGQVVGAYIEAGRTNAMLRLGTPSGDVHLSMLFRLPLDGKTFRKKFVVFPRDTIVTEIEVTGATDKALRQYHEHRTDENRRLLEEEGPRFYVSDMVVLDQAAAPVPAE